MKRALLVVAILGVSGLFLCMLAAAIGANGGTTGNNQSPAASSGTSPQPAQAATAKIGGTVTIGSSGLAVTLLNVFDPARGSNQFNTPEAGKRLVTADFKIVNNGQSTVRGNADNNTIIIGSDNQTYTSDLRSVSECTDFDYSSYVIVSGASQTGCVTFQLPNGISVATVRFTPHSGNSMDMGEWTAR